jgi:hypothetical protein
MAAVQIVDASSSDIITPVGMQRQREYIDVISDEFIDVAARSTSASDLLDSGMSEGGPTGGGREEVASTSRRVPFDLAAANCRNDSRQAICVISRKQTKVQDASASPSDMVTANGGVITPHRGIYWCVICSKNKDDIEAVASDSSVRPMFPLRCGHGICRMCLPLVARSSLSSRMVPARCCTNPISDTFVRAVLDQEEFAYYSYLLRKSKSTSTRPLLSTTTPVAVSSPLASPDPTEVAQAPSPPSAPATRSMGKQKLARKPTASKLVPTVDLARGDVVKAETGTGDGAVAVCHACATGISSAPDRFTAPCKHILCRNCIVARCRHAIANNEDAGGIGVPVRCCDQVLPLKFVCDALTNRDFAKYSSLFTKYEASHKTFPRKSSTRGQKRTASAAILNGTDDSINETRKKLRSSDALRSSTSVDNSVEDCASCMQQMSAAGRVKGPCGHAYCLSCFGYMVKLSLEDRAMVPVRCCGVEFPEDSVERVLPAKSWAVYRRFLAEKTPSESTLKSDKEYAALVRKIKGKQCPVCGVGVKKASGCPTMTCALGHVFCWNCGLQVCACAGQRLARQAMAQTTEQ